MNSLPPTLKRPENFDQSSSMWIDEALWGHRLYDEQTPWLVFLEFLTVFSHEDKHGRALDERGKPNELKYKAGRRLYLRNILFNNPHLPEIRLSNASDRAKWDEWFRRMRLTATGLDSQPEFGFLEAHFHSFDEFCEVVSLVRSTSLEVNSNKRWTSKFVFPYGSACLYEDLDNKASGNDRRFFGRTGEVLYLMLSRASQRQELLQALKRRLSAADTTWNSIVQCLQPPQDEPESHERANAFLPYASHATFDDLAADWLALLRLNIPGFDVYPHLVTLAGLHLLRYQLTVAQQYLRAAEPLTLVCEVVAPKKTLVREVSCDLYQSNNLLPAQAIEAFIANIERSKEWQDAVKGHGALEACRQILKKEAGWEDPDAPPDAAALLPRLRQDAIKRHRQHVGHIHRVYGREIGLVSKRGTVKLRYAPNDALLKTLLFTNVERRSELHQFLSRIHARYGLVFGDREAEQVLPPDEFDKKAFQNNSRRLEQRLGSLGLLRRLSDGCAYVVNPYHVEAQ